MAKKSRQSRFHLKQSTRINRHCCKKTSQISVWTIRSCRPLHYLLVWINKLQVKIQLTDEENGFEGIFDIVFTELHLLLLIFVATDSPHTEKACVHQAAQIRRILLLWSLLRMYNHTTWIIWHECRSLLLQLHFLLQKTFLNVVVAKEVLEFSYNAVKRDRQLPFLGPRGPHVESSISPVPSVRNNFSLVHR